jgi:transcriptional regulator
VPRVIEDTDWLRAHVEALTQAHEASRPTPWAVDDAPADFVSAQLRGIGGLEISIARIEGKWKLSQNRPIADRAGVLAGYAAAPRTHDMALLVAERNGLPRP